MVAAISPNYLPQASPPTSLYYHKYHLITTNMHHFTTINMILLPQTSLYYHKHHLITKNIPSLPQTSPYYHKHHRHHHLITTKITLLPPISPYFQLHPIIFPKLQLASITANVTIINTSCYRRIKVVNVNRLRKSHWPHCNH